MSVRVRPSVLSLICLPFLLLFFFLSGRLQAENNAIVGFQLLGGSGSPFWAHRMQDPYLLQRQDEALLHSLRTQNTARMLLELDRIRSQKPTVRSQTGRISFLASSGEWFAFGFSTIGSFAQVNHLPQANTAEYYDQLKRRDADFLYPAGVEYLAEVMYNQKRRSFGLSPNYMLSADMWIRPQSWYVQPFLRLGISAPLEENTANGIFTSSTGLQVAFNEERSVGLIVEGYGDAYRVLWEDYTGLQKDAIVWDAGWRAGLFMLFE